MLKIKTFIISVLLFVSLTVNAYAVFIPLIIPVAVGAVTLATAAGLGISYALNGGAISKVTPSGVITRSTTATYFALIGNALTPQLQTNVINTDLPLSTVATITAAKPALYPQLNTAKTTITDTWQPFTGVLPRSGDVYLGRRIGYASGTWPSGTGGNAGIERGYLQDGSPWSVGVGTVDIYCNTSVCTGGLASSVTTPTPTNSTFIASITVSPTDNNVKPEYQAEIDSMLNDPDYVPTFSDETTGLPWLPPSIPLTPEQLKTYNATEAAKALRATEIAAAQSAADSAQQAKLKAETVAAASDAVAKANPTDAAAQIKAAEDAAKAALAAALATKAQVLVQIKTDAQTVAETDTPAGIPDTKRKSLDFDPFKQLIGIMSTTYPFNLPLVIKSYYQNFSIEAQAPVFDLDLPLGQTIHVDCSVFDPIATMIRFLVGMLITVGIVYYIVHFFRGIS